MRPPAARPALMGRRAARLSRPGGAAGAGGSARVRPPGRNRIDHGQAAAAAAAAASAQLNRAQPARNRWLRSYAGGSGQRGNNRDGGIGAVCGSTQRRNRRGGAAARRDGGIAAGAAARRDGGIGAAALRLDVTAESARRCGST